MPGTHRTKSEKCHLAHAYAPLGTSRRRSLRTSVRSDLYQLSCDCFWGGVYPDSLGIYKSMRSEMREFPAVAAVLNSTDWHPRVRRRDAIDEDPTGIQVTSHFAGQLQVFGPEIAAQPELACVCCSNGCVNIRDAGHRRNRAEGLFIEGRHTLSDLAQDGGHVEGAFPFHRLAPA